MFISDEFSNATLEELKRGYISQTDHFLCLLCGTSFEKGRIYPEEDRFYEAERYMRIHIKGSHQSVFEYLIHLDKKNTGLTEHQSRLMQLFYQGISDAEVQKEMGIGSTSTISKSSLCLEGEGTSVQGVFNPDGAVKRKRGSEPVCSQSTSKVGPYG